MTDWAPTAVISDSDLLSRVQVLRRRHLHLGVLQWRSFSVSHQRWLRFFSARCTIAIAYSANHGLAIACHLSVRQFRLSVHDVGGLWSHRLEILETNCNAQPITYNGSPSGPSATNVVLLVVLVFINTKAFSFHNPSSSNFAYRLVTLSSIAPWHNFKLSPN